MTTQRLERVKERTKTARDRSGQVVYHWSDIDHLLRRLEAAFAEDAAITIEVLGASDSEGYKASWTAWQQAKAE